MITLGSSSAMADPKPRLHKFENARQRAIWLQGELKWRGTSLAAIAAAKGWHRSAVYRALYQPSLPQEQAIAEALGVELRELFPERYDRKGRRLHRARALAECRHDDVAGNDEALKVA
jgi:lambda repressor-like predicted transcriptional regulator